MVERSGCRLTGIDVEAAAIAYAEAEAAAAEIAGRWHDARVRRRDQLAAAEGAAFFDKRQRFLATTAELAGSGRLSRFLYAAERTG